MEKRQLNRNDNILTAWIGSQYQHSCTFD